MNIQKNSFEYEIIFPMYKDSVIDVFYGTYDEFVKHRERKFENEI